MGLVVAVLSQLGFKKRKPATVAGFKSCEGEDRIAIVYPFFVVAIDYQSIFGRGTD
jgi:hypothetical protein